MSLSRRLPAVACSSIALLALSGCAGQGNAENHNATAVVTQFAGSIRSNTDAACALLAPDTLKALQQQDGSCSTSLPKQVQPTDSPATSVQVYGKDAIVHIGTDTFFAARFRDGWRVTAAGCSPQPGRPYDCKVNGN